MPMTNNSLAHAFLETGILQFGRFRQDDGSFAPLSLNLRLLPSYPALAQAVAEALRPLIVASQPERLLTTRETSPLGGLLAVICDLPLAYPFGEASAYTVAYTIEGAFDVGHPTTLFAYLLSDELGELLENAGQVGLVVRHIVTLFNLNPTLAAAYEAQGIQVQALLNLASALPHWVDQGHLAPQMAQRVLAWLAEQGHPQP